MDGHFFQLFTLKNGWKSPNIHETMVVLGFQVVVLKQSKQSLVCLSIAKKLSKILKNLLLKFYSICTLPETNSSHLKVDGWKTRKFPFGARPLSGVRTVSFRESKWIFEFRTFSSSPAPFCEIYNLLGGFNPSESSSNWKSSPGVKIKGIEPRKNPTLLSIILVV